MESNEVFVGMDADSVLMMRPNTEFVMQPTVELVGKDKYNVPIYKVVYHYADCDVVLEFTDQGYGAVGGKLTAYVATEILTKDEDEQGIE